MKTSPLFKSLRYRIESTLLMAAWLFFSLIPLPLALQLADGLGLFVYRVLRIRRRVTWDNLRKAFPDKTRPEIDRIARAAYQHVARTGIEFLRIPKEDRKALFGRCVFQNRSLFDRALDQNKGAVLLTGHFGNWELYGAMLALAGYPISFVVKEQNNPGSDRLIQRIRRSSGATVIPLGAAIRGVLRDLRANRFVALVADQDAGRRGIFVRFFGRPASTAIGPGALALRTEAPILFGYALRRSRGRHLFFAEPLATPQGMSEAEAIRSVLQAYADRLERVIRKDPEQWFWMHKRWKTRSPEEKEKKR